MRLLVALLLAIGTARSLHAHSTPVPPSACTPEPLELAVPSIGLRAVADAPGAADQLRLVWDPAGSRVQLCPADPADPRAMCAGTLVPRAMAGLGPGASLALPVVFPASVLASGDLLADTVPVVLTLGGTPYPVTFAFGTGPVGTGGEVADAPGAPIAADGSLVLVGAARLANLPPPLTDAAAFLRLSCAAAPAPDLDQFAPAPVVDKLTGAVTAAGVTLRARIAAGDTPGDFTRPTVVLVQGSFGTRSLALADGLIAQGRNGFAGESANGQARITVKRVKRKPVPVYRVTMRFAGVVSPLPVNGSSLEVAVDVGGLVARASRMLLARRHGTVFSVR